jgi:hypothetical protein
MNTIDYINMVELMRNSTSNIQKCRDEKDTLKKCILCKNYLSSNQWSLLLEDHIKSKFNIGKCLNNTSGDGCSERNKNIEIKVSLGAINGQFHFVQLRPEHKIDYYLLLAYNLYENEIGKLYWFLCEASELYDLLPEYGGYAHGTIGKLGKITCDNIYDRNCEYALRPNPLQNDNNKPKILWNIMKERFSVSEKYIIDTI